MSEPRLCARCQSPRPPGRPRYCSDTCYQLMTAERERVRAAARMVACKRCGGLKERGVRGGKYCAECRRVMADVSTQREHEIARRLRIAAREERIALGERIHSVRSDNPDGMKWCARCQEFRPLTSFPHRSDTTRKVGSYCRPCQRAYNRERRTRMSFGLDWEDYEMLLACQDYRCAICLGKPRKHALAVDHDHATGEIRGLLCSRCNHRLLGSANDDPARLRAAADYLEAFTPREVFGTARIVPGFPQ